MSSLLHFFIGISTLTVSVYCLFTAFRDRKVILYLKGDEDGWLDIRNHPLKSCWRDEDIIVSDGDKTKITCSVDFNESGLPVIKGFDGDRLIKYWRPLPKPPEILKKHRIVNRRK